MKNPRGTSGISCWVEERFDREGLTAFGRARILVNFEWRALKLPPRLAALPVEKAPWPRWTEGDDLEVLLVLGSRALSESTGWRSAAATPGRTRSGGRGRTELP